MSGSRIAWRRVSRGLSLIGFGVFLLLSTQGQLRPGFWLDLWTYWPVLLVALGLRLMFEHSRAPWGVLLSPFLLVGTLSYVAWGAADTVRTDWETVQAARDPRIETWSLEAELALSDLDLRAGSPARGVLLQGRTSPSDLGRVRVSHRGDSSGVHLRGGHWGSGGVHILNGKRHLWDVEMSDDLPMSLRVASAFLEGELSLGTIEVTRVDLEGAFNDITLRLGAPRTDIRLDLEGAFNHLELLVPEDTPVRVTTDGFINLVDRRPGGQPAGGPAYRVHSEGAFNRVVIRSE